MGSASCFFQMRRKIERLFASVSDDYGPGKLWQADVTREKYSPRQIFFSGVKLASANFTPPSPERLHLTRQNCSYATCTPREECGLILAWLGTKHRQESWLACCIAAASEHQHEKDVLTPPEEQDQRGRGQLLIQL